jgi:hypothetical protein
MSPIDDHTPLETLDALGTEGGESVQELGRQVRRDAIRVSTGDRPAIEFLERYDIRFREVFGDEQTAPEVETDE